MKKILIVCIVALISSTRICAQTLPELSSIKLDTKEAFKSSEPVVLQAADYIIALPVDDENIDKLKSIQFLLKWMEGTPDYTFSISENPTSLFMKNTNLFGVYMAALCKYAITSKSTDGNDLNLNATRIFITYITDPAHHVKLNSGLKKLVEAEKNGELKSFLKIP
ncbi:MAG: hypothetical protein ABIN95_02260 [Mucilaginibacter sp.]